MLAYVFCATSRRFLTCFFDTALTMCSFVSYSTKKRHKRRLAMCKTVRTTFCTVLWHCSMFRSVPFSHCFAKRECSHRTTIVVRRRSVKFLLTTTVRNKIAYGLNSMYMRMYVFIPYLLDVIFLPLLVYMYMYTCTCMYMCVYMYCTSVYTCSVHVHCIMLCTY